MPATQSSNEKTRKRRFTPPADAAEPEAEADDAEAAPAQKPASSEKTEEADFDSWLESEDW